jgi:hypothetical protein
MSITYQEGIVNTTRLYKYYNKICKCNEDQVHDAIVGYYAALRQDKCESSALQKGVFHKIDKWRAMDKNPIAKDSVQEVGNDPEQIPELETKQYLQILDKLPLRRKELLYLYIKTEGSVTETAKLWGKSKSWTLRELVLAQEHAQRLAF